MNEVNVGDLMLSVPARVLATTEQRQTDLLSIIKDRHVLDPAILEERKPFFWDAEISSDLIDSYFTHMLPNTLANFRDDARTGVSFLPGHKHTELPFGRSLDAHLEDVADPPRTRVVADFYTLPGLLLNGVKTDDLIDGLRGGILRFVSVGFNGGQHFCDLCGRDFWDWECSHVPGVKYEIKDNGIVAVRLATLSISDARLAEVSSVFAGATPRAEILKAEREATEGRLRPEAIQMLEARYRTKLPTARMIFAGVDTPERNTKTMDFEKQVEQIRGIFGIDEAADVVGVAMTTNTELLKLRTTNEQVTGELTKLQERVAVLEPQAKDGERYRNDLVAAALGEGVRALGDKFDKKMYEEMLRAGPLDLVIRMKEAWSEIGNALFAGGRQTTDEGKDAPGTKQRTGALIPESAYKS